MRRVGKGAVRAVPTSASVLQMVGTLALCPPYEFGIIGRSIAGTSRRSRDAFAPE